MTTIAFDGTTLAADGQANLGWGIIPGGVPKIVIFEVFATAHEKGAIHFIAGSGLQANVHRFIEWYRKTERGLGIPSFPKMNPDEKYPNEPAKGNVLALSRSSEKEITMKLFEMSDPVPVVHRVIQREERENRIEHSIALGSGNEYALGAMFHGASASTATRIAGQLDVYSGGQISSYDVWDYDPSKESETF